MRFCSLGSGSSGNATVVETRGADRTSRVLIDCGFSLRELDLRLARAGLSAADLDAVFVTHEHGDHIGSALSLSRRDGMPVWMSRGTWRAVGDRDGAVAVRFARDGDTISIGDLELHPFTVSHDAEEPLQLRCSDAVRHVGVLTDAGCITDHMLAHLQGLDALLLECNHDRAMLAASRYPPGLKARIGGRFGHLANDTSAEIVTACRHPGLRHLVAAHLSRENNHPDLVRASLGMSWGRAPMDIVIAHPQRGFAWITIE